MGLATIITVLIIDTGIMPIAGLDKIVANPTVEASNIHGSQVTYIASGKAHRNLVCPQVVFYSCDFLENSVEYCLYYALAHGFDYINMSLSGDVYSPMEYALIKTLTDKGTIVTVAAGNEGVDLEQTPRYPASYLYRGLINFHVVGDKNYFRSNRGSQLKQGKASYKNLPTGKYSYGSNVGTSFSAPDFLRKLLYQKCKEVQMLSKEFMCAMN